MTPERLSITKKCCLNCKEWKTYGSVCNPFGEDPAKYTCNGHLFDREDLLRRATAIEAENAELRAQLEAQRVEPDLYVYHHSPLTYDVFEDRETAESIAKTGLGELIPVWKAPQRGGAVVVPEITRADLEKITNDAHAHYVTNRDDDGCEPLFLRDLNEWFRSRIQPVDASQVLQPGMVGVDAKRLAALEAISDKIEALALGPDGRAWTPLHYREFARGELRNALRSQAGGEG